MRRTTAAAFVILAAATTGVLAEETPASVPPSPQNWNVLTMPVVSDDDRPPLKVRVTRPLPAPKTATFARRSGNADGTAAVTVGRQLPTVWDSKVGVDLGIAAPAGTVNRLDAALGQAGTQPASSAWATLVLPGPDLPASWDKTALEARFDPFTDQTRLGATLSRSIALSDGLALTLQNGYAMTQPLGADAGTALNWSTDRTVKLHIAATNTTLAAAETLNSTDNKWLYGLSAEQKLFGGPVSITGAANETVDGEMTKSISARFTRNW